jgi:hypothetical protein
LLRRRFGCPTRPQLSEAVTQLLSLRNSDHGAPLAAIFIGDRYANPKAIVINGPNPTVQPEFPIPIHWWWLQTRNVAEQTQQRAPVRDVSATRNNSPATAPEHGIAR